MSVHSGEGSDAGEYVDQDDIEIVLEDDGDQQMDEDDEDGEGELNDEQDMNPDEEIIVEDTSIQSFSQHSPKSVFAVAAHPSAPVAVSGGEDDAGYLWDTITGEILQKLDGHTDSVVAVGFSHDGGLVATGGMDGRIRVWKKAEDKKWEFLIQLDGVDEVVVRTPSVPMFYITDPFIVVKMASSRTSYSGWWTRFYRMDVPAPLGKHHANPRISHELRQHWHIHTQWKTSFDRGLCRHADLLGPALIHTALETQQC